jgi:hypothetical protein
MPKYNVYAQISVTVEAESEKEAEKIGKLEIAKLFPDGSILFLEHSFTAYFQPA